MQSIFWWSTVGEEFGWGPINGAIQKYVEDPLSEKILLSEFSMGDEIEVGVAEGKDALSFRVPSPSKPSQSS